jgi:hypothetical protein
LRERFIDRHKSLVSEAHVFPGKNRTESRRGWIFCTLLLSVALILVSCGGGSSGTPAIRVPIASGFSLTTAPNNPRTQQDSSVASTVTINPTGGFSGSVSLSASGLPSGVTASFNPSSTGSTSILTFTATSGAALGTVNVMVTGTANSASQTSTIALTIFVPPPANSVPASFFAVNNVNPGDNPATDGLNYGAVGHPIRLAWPYIETSRGVFDFSLYDQYAAIAPREGTNGNIAVMDLTLGMTPSWAVSDQSSCRAAPDGTITCQAPPDNIADWQAFITALVNHYNGSSSSQPYIKYYEIWNEWNVVDASNGFWSGTISQLVNLEQTACTIIHAQALNFSFVLTPSTVGPATTSNNSAPQALQQFFSAGGNACIDGVSFHGNLGLMSLNPFPLPGEGCQGSGCNGTIVQIVDSYRQIMNQNNFAASVPLFDTEGGFESANITDSDQRAAWLAQFYALQSGLFNSDQLQWVSWFTWGAPGVAGNIETASQTPDTGGVAYNQLYNWLLGRLPTPCVQNGKIWTCGLTGSASYQAEIIWDDSQTCSGGNCSTAAQQVPSWVTGARDLAGNPVTITNGTVPLGLKPIIVENQ